MGPRWSSHQGRLTDWLSVGPNVALIVQLVQCSAVEWSELVGEWVSEWVRGLQFSPGELLLLEAGSWDTGIDREQSKGNVRSYKPLEPVYRHTHTGENVYMHTVAD
jgi:hypothetical protein